MVVSSGVKRFQLSALTPSSSYSGQRHRSAVRDASSEERFVAIEHALHLSEIADALQRVLAHELMRKCPKLQAFLIFIVEETLAGRGDRLKAYSIAIAALGKQAEFDPSADPIVRVEASRLRRCLNDYYLSDGQNDPMRITIPKGSYRPVFKQDISISAETSKISASSQYPDLVHAIDDRMVRADVMVSSDAGQSGASERLYRITQIMLVANIGILIFIMLVGFHLLDDVDRINQHMDQFHVFWTQHITAQAD